MMITMLTGVSQAGRRPRWGAGAPPWDPSAEVLASVSLTAGLSLNHSITNIPGQPVRRPRTPARPGVCGGGGHRPAHSGSYRPGRAERLIVAQTRRSSLAVKPIARAAGLDRSPGRAVPGAACAGAVR